MKLFFIFFLAALACFFPLLSLSFYYDDLSIVQGNTLLGSLSHIPDFFRGIVDSQHEMNGCYRPLFLTYLSMASTISKHPTFLRVLGFLLHALNATLLFYLCLKFYKLRREFALVVTLVFLLHPLHVTSLSLVWKQTDLWIAAFALLTITAWHHGASLKFFIPLWSAALLFKESAVILPALGLLLWMLTPAQKSYRQLAGILAMCFLNYVYLKFLPRLTSPATINSDGNPFGALQYFWSQLHVIPQYFYALIFPGALTLDRSVSTIIVPGAYEYSLTFLLGISLVVAFVRLFLHRSLGAFLYLLALLWLLPTSSFHPLSLLYDETRMYLVLPSGLVFLALITQTYLPAFKRSSLLPTLAFVMMSLVHLTHAHQWNTTEAIWRHSTHVNESRGICGARAHFELGRLYEKERALDDAEAQYRQTLACTQDIPQAWLHLGIVLGQKGELTAAAQTFSHVPEKEPYWRAQAEYYLGLNAYYQRDLETAKIYFKRAHELSPSQKLCEKGLSILLKKPVTTCE